MMSLVVALLAVAGAAVPAQARTFVSVGIGVGPYWPGAYGPYWHRPYWGWRDPYWAAYPAVYAAPYAYYGYSPYGYAPYAYAPPPVAVAPPPVAFTQPAPQPVQAVAAAKPGVDQSYCREYTSTITVAGHPTQQVGTACRQPDGSWRVMN
ncbi:MAG: hypothetical protein PW843_01960 [Azospirillaceae bacterium]|nr:hypothetical protein [Azospirillaceae bacterium]